MILFFFAKRNLVFFQAVTQLARQVPQEHTQVVCSNKVDRSRLALRHSRCKFYFYVLFYDCCFGVDIRIRRYTNKR